MRYGIVLCSGGLDSVTTAHYIKKKISYDSVSIVFFDYGQRTREAEERCARSCARDLRAKFMKISLPWLKEISASLIHSRKKTQKLSRKDLRNTLKASEPWYVPCRNTLFLAYALALAENLFITTKKKYDLFVGFKCEGREHYPDTTPDFVAAMNQLSTVSCAKPFRVIAPLIKKDKEDIVLLAFSLGIDLKQTFSCYVGPDVHCGSCLACLLRKEGFYWANAKDPTIYLSSLK